MGLRRRFPGPQEDKIRAALGTVLAIYFGTMNYPGYFCLLVCSVAVVVIALALPFVTARLPESERKEVPIWAVLAGVTFGTYSALRVAAASPGYDRFFYSFVLTSILLCRIWVKWLMESVAQKKLLIREVTLCGSLLAAPLLNVASIRLFPSILTPAICLFWFFNGYFWYALLNDLERIVIRERAPIRRREPPTLPYDFRKPEASEQD